MKRLFRVSSLILLLTAGTQARADDIAWNYNWSRTPPAILAGTGGISFTDQPTTEALNSSDIVATNLKVFSSADTKGSPGHPPMPADQIGSNGMYSLTLTIQDERPGAGAAQSLTWNGQLTGNFSMFNSNVANTFQPTPGAPPLTQFAKFGNGDVFTVTIGPYSPPGDPADPHSGSIGAHVDISEGSGHDLKTPEPTTMVLSFVGLSVFGGAAWRRRRPLAA
jgi:hypothetical protein